MEKKLKKKVNSGEEYLTATNKVVSARAIRGVCGKACRLQCPSKISVHEQNGIHRSYWRLTDHALQRNFIVANSSQVIPKYRLNTEGSKRGYNTAYYFTVGEEKIRVCKDYFMKTLDIGDKFIRNAFKKLDRSGVLEKERRGLHGNQRKISEAVKNDIRNHIRSFPRIESHYLRAQSSREYLDGSLTLSEMYRVYTQHQKALGKECAKKCMYEKVFSTEFNISFFSPKKDQCCLCESYKNTNDPDEGLKSKYKLHIQQKELSRLEKNNDIKAARESQNILVACYDLQAVLQAPCGDISVLYYKRKLNCYNFTVYNTTNKHGLCYFWNESVAKRGVNEIGSCVLMYIREYCVGKNVVFYSDNCCGQNKNKGMASLYLHAVQNFNILTIEHKFLIVGHTQNEGDSMHSVIEQQKKRMLRSGPIYTPTQWTPILRLAKKGGKPYDVKEISTSDVMDLKLLSRDMGPNFTINTNDEKVKWNDIKVMRFEDTSPNIIFYKTDYSETEFKQINTKRRLRGRPSDPSLKPAYITAPKIPAPKVKDLVELCKSNVIPPVYHQFYLNLQPGE